ncbi:hypothetical protein MKW98_009754 [Papaver atlanticum]|uniref:DNA-directed RNA polymerase III subunit RPC5 n=1 Tax=Papaver atlanticum TaxID=357466 RepID=A0AAD4SXJ8_9MAGN|nr:hypothetical protein MKW98_009754 [Papaver atlanticum]
MDMDLDLSTKSSSRPSSFTPKTPSKFKPKIPKSEPLIVPKSEVHDFKPDEELKQVEVISKEELKVEPMEVDNNQEEEGDDEVVREIDVFFNPSAIDADTQLYVLQYPLRPSWRPYDMDQKCQKVRFKPKEVQVEIDLSLDLDENYDDNVDDHLRITKQTLVSKKVPLTKGCAVGVLVGNQLHLNPVDTLVHLRPSMEHVIPGGLKNKNSVEATIKSEKTTGGPRASTTRGNLVRPLSGQDTKVEEPWVTLEYHGTDSIFSSRFRQKMTSDESTPIRFSMNPYNYANALCPPTPINDDGRKTLLRRLCLSLPLKEKFEKWFVEGDQVSRFVSLKYLAPNDPEEIVLQEIQQHANLVQGFWVCKTNLLPLKGAEMAARDKILCLFSKTALIPDKILGKILEELGCHNDEMKKATADAAIGSIAVHRDKCRDWKFKVPTDMSFIKDHPEIVKEQEHLWRIRENTMVRKTEHSVRNKRKPSMVKSHVASGIPIQV